MLEVRVTPIAELTKDLNPEKRPLSGERVASITVSKSALILFIFFTLLTFFL